MPFKDPEKKRQYMKEYSHAWYLKHKDDPEFQARKKREWIEWYEKNKDHVRQYKRHTRLGNGGQITYGLHKREWTGYCELCEKIVEKNLHYHHWDDSDKNKGIWVCAKCNRICDGFENLELLSKYQELKKKVEQEIKDNILHLTPEIREYPYPKLVLS